MTTPSYAAAREYAELGYHPIPVAQREKRPLVPWKNFQTTRPTSAELDRWWTPKPDANVGLVLGGGRFAVDLDGGADAEALLSAAGISLPEDAPRSRTGGGYHVFLSAYNSIPTAWVCSPLPAANPKSTSAALASLSCRPRFIRLEVGTSG